MFQKKAIKFTKRTMWNQAVHYLCMAVLIFLISALPVSATMVAETDGFPATTGIGYAPDSTGFFGDLSFSFTTDANDYTFNSINLVLGNGAFSNGTGSFFVTLNEDNGATPGTALELLSGETDPTVSNTEYQYTGSSILAANTTYWISLINMDETGDNFYDFLSADTTAESAASVWSIGDDIYSSVSGFQGATGPFLSRFDATIVAQTPVPEPASALLFMVGLIGFVGLRRKQ